MHNNTRVLSRQSVKMEGSGDNWTTIHPLGCPYMDLETSGTHPISPVTPGKQPHTISDATSSPPPTFLYYSDTELDIHSIPSTSIRDSKLQDSCCLSTLAQSENCTVSAVAIHPSVRVLSIEQDALLSRSSIFGANLLQQLSSLERCYPHHQDLPATPHTSETASLDYPDGRLYSTFYLSSSQDTDFPFSTLPTRAIYARRALKTPT
ncbi:hypothetical protein F5Y19DRAFT_220746 [Xylariaceae sp. FL1651]|nr:hypothetical protein F5Y19DRAFT_220746 [Xylariaceae sp. FL1651]